MWVLTYSDRYEDVKDIIDGYLIPGGRDINPENYGQQNTHSKFNEIEAKLRYDHVSDFLSNGNQKMPILGICFGL